MPVIQKKKLHVFAHCSDIPSTAFLCIRDAFEECERKDSLYNRDMDSWIAWEKSELLEILLILDHHQPVLGSQHNIVPLQQRSYVHFAESAQPFYDCVVFDTNDILNPLCHLINHAFVEGIEETEIVLLLGQSNIQALYECFDGAALRDSSDYILHLQQLGVGDLPGQTQ